MTTIQEALPCPFCGDAADFDGNAADWQDEGRYVELSLKCCATMIEAIGWRRARDMTVAERAIELQTKLIERWNTRTALAQQREQQPVCHGCGIPAGDVHMSTCKSGKWPSRVSNGDTAAPAPQPEPAGWQKIETAPEGTMILCANMKAMDARSWAYVAWIAGGKVCGYRMDMPTHWMPLPTPPKEQQ